MFGQKLRILRKYLGLSQAELAELSGVKQFTISAYETETNVPNLEAALALDKALKRQAIKSATVLPCALIELEPA